MTTFADTPIRVVLEVKLACGCTLKHAFTQEHGTAQPGNFPMPAAVQNAAVFGAGKLGYWYQVRGMAHRCELVSESNPNGIPSRNSAA